MQQQQQQKLQINSKVEQIDKRFKQIIKKVANIKTERGNVAVVG